MIFNRSLTLEEVKKKHASNIVHLWYFFSISKLKRAFIETCDSKDIDVPDYFPGRHWLSDLKDMWKELYPDSDNSTYHQICGDVLTILGVHLFFSDFQSTNFVVLHDYLINNYETTRMALVRIATNMKAFEVADRILGSVERKIPNEDGSIVYDFCGKPMFVFFGGHETEIQKLWRKIKPESIAHQFCPNSENPTNEVAYISPCFLDNLSTNFYLYSNIIGS